MLTAVINCRSFDVLFCHQDDLESCKAYEDSEKS